MTAHVRTVGWTDGGRTPTVVEVTLGHLSVEDVERAIAFPPTGPIDLSVDSELVDAVAEDLRAAWTSTHLWGSHDEVPHFTTLARRALEAARTHQESSR